jgi:hypothetical protein
LPRKILAKNCSQQAHGFRDLNMGFHIANVTNVRA